MFGSSASFYYLLPSSHCIQAACWRYYGNCRCSHRLDSEMFRTSLGGCHCNVLYDRLCKQDKHGVNKTDTSPPPITFPATECSGLALARQSYVHLCDFVCFLIVYYSIVGKLMSLQNGALSNFGLLSRCLEKRIRWSVLLEFVKTSLKPSSHLA